MIEDNHTAEGTNRPFPRQKSTKDLCMHLVTEFRYAWRMIRKTPAASALAVLSLALGIGANTAIFTLVNTVLLKLLPVKASEELYLVGSHPQHLRTSWNYPDYRAMRDHNTVFEGLAGYSLGLQTMGVQLGDAAAQASELTYGILISGNYFGRARCFARHRAGLRFFR
jgi:hypothetical protein